MDIFIIVVLLLLSALFSASETAYSTVNMARLHSLADDGNKRAIVAIKNYEKFDKILTAILFGNTLTNLTIATIAGVSLIENYGVEKLWLGMIVTFVLIILFGEFLPKSLAGEFPESFAMFIASPLKAYSAVMIVLTWPLLLIKKLIVKLRGEEEKQPSVTEEDLKYLIEEIEDEGVLNEEESDLVKSAIEFSDISISEILIPRVNVAAVDIEDDIDEIKETFVSTFFSRLPVYDKTLDNIVGIIHQKTFFEMYFEGERDLKKIIQKPLYIFGMASISEVMREMQKTKNHIAIVVDQYGGTQGIVTMEDIIEELVGEIYDETDEEDNSFVKLSEENEYEVSAELSIRDFLDNIELDEDEIETESTSIGGLLMEHLDHIPENGETVNCGRFTFTVIECDEQKIERVHVVISEVESLEESDGVTEENE